MLELDENFKVLNLKCFEQEEKCDKKEEKNLERKEVLNGKEKFDKKEEKNFKREEVLNRKEKCDIKKEKNLESETVLNEDEIWKESIKYKGYSVSSLGRLKTPRGHISQAKSNKNTGYIQVSVKEENKKPSMKFLHRIVAETFITNIENKPEVDHIDGNRSNAKVSNLRWVTKIENANNKVFANHVPSTRSIDQYSLNDEFIKTWESIKDVRSFYNFSRRKFKNVCDGKIESYQGFKWYYHEEKKVIPGETWIDFKIKNKIIKVSSAGRICGPSGNKTFGSCKTNFQDKDSYMYYSTTRVHRIVMLAFHPIEDADKFVVDHIDGNKKNNSLENLRWTTHSQNSQHAHDMGAYKDRNIPTKSVIQLSIFGEFIKEFKSMAEAGRSTGGSGDAISICIKGKSKSSSGFKWMLASEYYNKIKNSENKD